MKRFLLFLFLSACLACIVQAQVTKLSSNTSLDFVVPLGTSKTLLVEAVTQHLWVSDGTAGGTFKLSNTLIYNDAGGLLNDKYIFSATGPLGSELYITDGTVAGTQLVKDINPGTAGGDPADDFALVSGYLYFSATTPDAGRELWRTDGTEGGTTLVKDIVAGPAGSALKNRFNIASAGSYLLFSSSANATGYELWRSDGTAGGTMLLKDINPGTASSSPSAFQVYNGIALFWAETVAEGRELWRTDGTAGGTQLVKDIRPGPSSSMSDVFPFPNLEILYPFNNKLLFIANDGTHGNEIWSTDGTTAGTFLLKDINPDPVISFLSLFGGVPLKGTLYFAAYREDLGAELWQTDGTPEGTKLFKEILPGSDGGTPFLMPNFRFSTTSAWPVHQGNMFYFMFGLPADGGVELWKSDGTNAGTVRVKTLKTTDSEFGNLSYVYTNAGLYFSVDDGEHGDELWKSNGTEAGTMLVLDLNPNKEDDGTGNLEGAGSEISFLPFPVNNKFLFTATDGDNELKWDLYRLDGDLIPLPVKWQSFTVQQVGDDGKLAWQTASEQNTLYFVVERSSDGNHFSSIGTVAAAGSSTEKRNYSFTDAGIAKSGQEVVYYRLRIKDRGGEEAISGVRSLRLQGRANLSVQILGNPVRGDIRISLTNDGSPVSLIVRDAAGRTLKTVLVKNMNNLITLPATDLPPGVYFLVAESRGKSGVVRFLKQ